MLRAFIIRILGFSVLICTASVHLMAQEIPQLDYYDASALTLVGKLMPTSNPYHRVDTVKYKGFTSGENLQVRCPAGVAVAFKTDSKDIYVRASLDVCRPMPSTMIMATSGFDLYIKKDGDWIWAGNTAYKRSDTEPHRLVINMDGAMHECLLYLPIYSEVFSCEIGVLKGSRLEATDSPFRHRVVVFGSSYTHGISSSRPGMSYPMQFTRHTGIQMVSLGCNGNCKLQPYFADVLVDVEADAFVFDAFSNPPAQMIEERLFPFIEKVQAAHPGVPLIFQQTIYRESRNFNTGSDSFEQAKMDMADSLMRIAVRKYKDVYFIHPDASVASHESTVDGTHPDDYGYYLWSKSIEKPIKRILRKYGIK